MDIRLNVLWMILGAGLLTWLPRVLPFAMIRHFTIPEWMLRFLKHVPIAVMAALLAQSLLVADDQLVPLTDNQMLYAAAPTFIVAILTRSLLGTVLTGILAMWLIQWLA